ncbi:MAG: IPT/TIG domain-containing protein [Pseudobacter sp.]|uniref:IPT/TIG domain-containing protein n=1 Tax=Pseudobacter sp. TaxID=2045420 RepID=UPI003F7EE883
MKKRKPGSLPGQIFRYAVMLVCLSLTYVACKKDDKKNGESPDTTLKIASFNPASGAAGSPVTITGQAFAATKSANIVKFNGVQADVVSVSEARTELTVTIPQGAKSGKITVEVDGKTVSSETSFTYVETAPVIEEVTPMKGDVNNIITIKGKRFGTDAEVHFGGIKATVLDRKSETLLETAVPAGALNGKIKVTSNNIETFTAAVFWVRPSITMVSPLKQVEGGEITIDGTNFSTTAGENFVYFGDVRATEITEATATRLKVKVPEGAKDLNIKVAVMEQEAMSAQRFVLLPTITSFSPATAKRGDIVTITGKNISAAAKIFIDNLEITVTEPGRTTSNVQFKIPETAVAGKLLVKYADITTEAGDLQITNYWKKITTTTSTNLYNNIAFVYNNKIYAGLGSKDQSNAYTRDFKSFNFTTKQWEHAFTAPSKVGTRLNAYLAIHGAKVFIGGGLNIQNTDPYVRDMWEFDPSKASTPDDPAAWIKTGPTVNPYAAGAFSYNGNLYTEVNGIVSRYNPAGAGSLETVATSSLLNDQVNGRAYVINNEVYFFGGGTRSQNAILLDLIKFNPANNQFTSLKKLPGSILPYGAITFVLNNKLYAVTLTNPGAGTHNTMEYDPATNEWTDRKITLIESQLTSGSKYNSAVIDGKAYIWTVNGTMYELVP